MKTLANKSFLFSLMAATTLFACGAGSEVQQYNPVPHVAEDLERYTIECDPDGMLVQQVSEPGVTAHLLSVSAIDENGFLLPDQKMVMNFGGSVTEAMDVTPELMWGGLPRTLSLSGDSVDAYFGAIFVEVKCAAYGSPDSSQCLVNFSYESFTGVRTCTSGVSDSL